MGITVRSSFAEMGTNFWADISDGVVIVKGKDSNKTINDKHIIKDGKMMESIIREGAYKRHEVYNKFTKVYDNNRLTLERYYSKKFRMVKKGLFYKYYHKDYILERYSSGYSMQREILYYKNGKIAYITRKKDIDVFNPDGSLLAKIMLSKPISFYSATSEPMIDIKDIKNLTATFEDKWYYEIYDKNGKVCSWLKGNGTWRTKGMKNGKTLYFIEGIRVPKKLIDGKYDAKYILSYPNVTIRSHMIKEYGVEKIIQELGGKSIDKTDTYELLRFPLPVIDRNVDDKYMQVLKMRCPSTQVWYALRVPPDCENIKEALNWTYGEELNDIRDKNKVIDIIKET